MNPSKTFAHPLTHSDSIDLPVSGQHFELDSNDLHEEAMIALSADHRLAGCDIQASFKNGIMYLTGSVAEIKMKLYAEQAVQDLPGVLSVSNNIRLAPNPDDIGSFSAAEKIM